MFHPFSISLSFGEWTVPSIESCRGRGTRWTTNIGLSGLLVYLVEKIQDSNESDTDSGPYGKQG